MLFLAGVFWVVKKISPNYVEVTKEGLRQDKTFISWKDVLQVEETKGYFGQKQIHIQTEGNKVISLGTHPLWISLHELDSLLTLVVKQAKLVKRKTDIKSYAPGGVLAGIQDLIRVWTKPRAKVKLPLPERVDFPPFNLSQRTMRIYVWGVIVFSGSILGFMVLMGNDWVMAHIPLITALIFIALASLFQLPWIAFTKYYGIKKGFLLALIYLLVWMFGVPFILRNFGV